MELGEPDSSGRRRPIPIEGSDFFMECDTVIIAVGQKVDSEVLGCEPDLEITSGGFIKVDPDTLATSVQGVFGGGDMAFGPRIAISAIADGKRAALNIHQYLKKGTLPSRRAIFKPANMNRYIAEYDRVPRQNPPTLSTGRRTGFREVEQVYDSNTAITQADRCLWCHISPIFNSSLCILCGGCVDICPERCLAIVPVEKLVSSEPLDKIVESKNAHEHGAAIIKDETLCIRCGLCARRCPTGAITMERISFEED